MIYYHTGKHRSLETSLGKHRCPAQTKVQKTLGKQRYSAVSRLTSTIWVRESSPGQLSWSLEWEERRQPCLVSSFSPHWCPGQSSTFSWQNGRGVIFWPTNPSTAPSLYQKTREGVAGAPRTIQVRFARLPLDTWKSGEQDKVRLTILHQYRISSK